MQESLRTTLRAAGHCLGRDRVDNHLVASRLGLADDWLTRRTGIEQRRVCAPDENALSLASEAVRSALRMAELEVSQLGQETALLYIHNSLEQGTPPAGTRLAALLGLRYPRTITVEGACAEAVQALELADSLLIAGRCSRVILVAGVDYPPLINPRDPATIGLFGSGAGALILERSADSGLLGLAGSDWHNDTSLSRLGGLCVHHFEQHEHELQLSLSYYWMDGEELARFVLAEIPGYFGRMLSRLGWQRDQLDSVIAHQPNAKLLRLLANRMGLEAEQMPIFCYEVGNLGPASLLVGLSLWLEQAHAGPARILLLGFGLGFCCGSVAFERC